MRQTAKLNMMNTPQLCIGKKIANETIKEFQTKIEKYYMLINIITRRTVRTVKCGYSHILMVWPERGLYSEYKL